MTRIVVGVDDSDGSALALRWAMREHRLHGGTITALHAWSFVDASLADAPPSGEDPTRAGVDPSFCERRVTEQVAAMVRAVLGPEAVDVVVRVVEDHPAAALLGAAADADLLVVGARGLGGFRGLLVGSISQRVVHESHVPVAVVRAPRTSRPWPDERIVVGVDGSPTSKRALHWAVVEADRRRATVDVVHAWTIPTIAGPYLAPMPVVDAIRTAATDVVAAAIESERCGANGATVRPLPLEGRPARTLLEEAADADLVVVGSRGHGTIGRLALGSVSSQVLTHAPCTVVVVPPG